MFPSGAPDAGTLTLLVGVTAVHAVLFALLLRRQQAARATDRVTDRNGQVVCRECGTTNDPEYTFCRACVTQLPGTSSVGADRAFSAESPR